MEWISVKDRLPEEDGIYIVANSKTATCARRILGIWTSDGHRFDFERSNITHWMPIPEPPKE